MGVKGGAESNTALLRAAVQETAAQTDAPQQQHDISHSGSIYGVGGRFQTFRINDLEMVAQICPRWNRLQPWFELVGAFKDAA